MILLTEVFHSYTKAILEQWNQILQIENVMFNKCLIFWSNP